MHKLPFWVSTFIFSLIVANAAHASWQQAPALPYRVQEIYPTVFDKHIVVAGGLSPDIKGKPIGVSDRVVVYSLSKNTWSEGPSFPEPRHHPMLVTVDNRLFSFGGFTRDTKGFWHNSADVLELVLDQSGKDASKLSHGYWQKVGQMPAPLAETLSAVHNGKVHLVSGRTPITQSKNSQWNDQSDVTTHYIFDPENLSFTQAPAMPTARNSACSVSVNQKMYTIAGRTVAGGNLANHEMYDFNTQKWHSLAPLPDAQGGLACASLGDDIYVFGGEYFNNGGGVYADVWHYSISKDSWRSVTTMPIPRHGLGALTVDDKIYVIGGGSKAGGGETRDTMSVFTP